MALGLRVLGFRVLGLKISVEGLGFGVIFGFLVQGFRV